MMATTMTTVTTRRTNTDGGLGGSVVRTSVCLFVCLSVCLSVRFVLDVLPKCFFNTKFSDITGLSSHSAKPIEMGPTAAATAVSFCSIPTHTRVSVLVLLMGCWLAHSHQHSAAHFAASLRPKASASNTRRVITTTVSCVCVLLFFCVFRSVCICISGSHLFSSFVLCWLSFLLLPSLDHGSCNCRSTNQPSWPHHSFLTVSRCVVETTLATLFVDNHQKNTTNNNLNH